MEVKGACCLVWKPLLFHHEVKKKSWELQTIKTNYTFTSEKQRLQITVSASIQKLFGKRSKINERSNFKACSNPQGYLV